MKAGTIRWLILGCVGLATACGDDGVNVDVDANDGVDAPIDDIIRPGKRSDVAGVADPVNNKLAIFGGDDGPIVGQIPSPAYLGDTWVYEPGTGWTEIVSAASPSARGRHAVAVDGSSRMLVFGGRWREAGTTGDYTLYNDLWAFDMNDDTWTLLDDGQAGGPAPRYFSAGAYSSTQGAFYVFGGDIAPSALTIDAQVDVWAHDGTGWTEVATAGTPPTERLFVSYAYDSQRDRLVIYGGQIGDFVTPALGDLHAIDLATGEWSLLHDGAANAPVGRFLANMTYDSARDRYIMFGGHTNAGTDNDVWAFDPNTDTWTELNRGDVLTDAPLGCNGNPSEIPPEYVEQDLDAPERRQTGLFAPLGDDIYLFGGEGDCSDHLDDLWTLSPDGTWTEIVPARSGESCARRNDACQCLCI